ncbi:MAG: DUF4388 domain-containing protein [Deltaproteobacteria bacterium]|nr:DUF4388 domain-containing protein [Deltaproteobacteria bacterium]
MATKRTLLIADPDLETLRVLKKGLQDDYEVQVVRDGSKALEASILKYPDLILFYRRCPLIGATQFARILRTNPRTEEIPLIILSDEPVAPEGAHLSYLQGVLVKPLNLDEVKARLAAVFRKVETAKAVGTETGAVSGSLDQISMADLLQIFSLNRRSGCLQLSGGPDGVDAEVYLHEGRLEEATVGVARGEKALFRLLSWSGGRFAFVPSRRAPSVSLTASTDSLLMEGMRQGDELARISAELPPRGAKVERLVPPEGLPDGLHRVTAEIFALAEYYPRVADLTDRAQATDLEVGLALKALVDAKLLRVADEAEAGGAKTLLTADQILELRSRLRRAGLAPTYLGGPKVAVLAADPEDVWQLGVALSRLKEFTAANLERLVRLPLGTLGTLQLDRSLTVDFYVVPTEHRLLPLAFGLSAGSVAAVVVGSGALESLSAALGLLEGERRAGVLIVRRPQDPAVAVSGRRKLLEVADLGEDSTRRLVTMLLTQVVGTDLRGVTL